MKTIGTLEEIGAQVGDVVGYSGSYTYTVMSGNRLKCANGDVMLYQFWDSADCFSIVTRAAKSPVRMVTRKEIVPGIYGRLQVSSDGYHAVNISAKDPGFSWTASDLTAAIATLTEIRDAMAGDE